MRGQSPLLSSSRSVHGITKSHMSVSSGESGPTSPTRSISPLSPQNRPRETDTNTHPVKSESTVSAVVLTTPVRMRNRSKSPKLSLSSGGMMTPTSSSRPMSLQVFLVAFSPHSLSGLPIIFMIATIIDVHSSTHIHIEAQFSSDLRGVCLHVLTVASHQRLLNGILGCDATCYCTVEIIRKGGADLQEQCLYSIFLLFEQNRCNFLSSWPYSRHD